MTRPWHEEAAEWLSDARPDPSMGVVYELLAAALAEREEMLTRASAFHHNWDVAIAEHDAALARADDWHRVADSRTVEILRLRDCLEAAEARVRALESRDWYIKERASGAAAERAAIVAWLRQQFTSDAYPMRECRWAADGIESGAHLAQRTADEEGER